MQHGVKLLFVKLVKRCFFTLMIDDGPNWSKLISLFVLWSTKAGRKHSDRRKQRCQNSEHTPTGHQSMCDISGNCLKFHNQKKFIKIERKTRFASLRAAFFFFLGYSSAKHLSTRRMTVQEGGGKAEPTCRRLGMTHPYLRVCFLLRLKERSARTDTHTGK